VGHLVHDVGRYGRVFTPISREALVDHVLLAVVLPALQLSQVPAQVDVIGVIPVGGELPAGLTQRLGH